MAAALKQTRRRHLVTVALMIALGLSLPARPALANGAFPDSLQLMLPADRPQQIIFSTNFGLIISDDGGLTWSWTCEQANINFANLYQVGPPPNDTLYAISPVGFGYSNDDSCTWNLATGSVDNSVITDSFADPTDPNRVLVIAISRAEGEVAYQVHASQDGGKTFATPIYTAPVQGGLLGVEIARSDPRIVYLALYETPGIQPRLVRSTDGGATWEPPLDIQPMLGSNWFRIIAVDPANPARLFLRVAGKDGETLAITEDGGATFTSPVIFRDRMTAFVQLPSGTLLVTGSAEGKPAGFRSTDGGKTFEPWENVPDVRALGTRDGKLYVVGDNFRDHFAVAVSTDEGRTLTGLTTFDKVSSIRSCAQAQCEDLCHDQAGLKLWPPETCLPGGGDAGAGSDGGRPRAKDGGGCGCSVTGPGSLAAGMTLALVLAAWPARRARRDRRYRRAHRDRRDRRYPDVPPHL